MWKKFLSKSKKDGKEVDLPTLPIGFQKTLTNFFGQGALPSMPQSAQKAFQVVTNPNSEALDFVDAIESDEGLSSRIIKVANSVYFSRGEPCESVVEAVTIIGTNELRGILSASTLNSLFPSTHPLRDALWSHNLSVAIFSRELAARFQAGLESEAYIAGLLHDVGKLLLLTVDTPRYAEITMKAGTHGNFSEVEEEQYPFNHTEVGHFVASEWQFSQQLIKAIRLHHLPFSELEPRSLPMLVSVANLLSHKLRIGFPKGLTTLQNNASIKLAEAFEILDLNGDRGRELTKKLELTYNEEKEIHE